MFYGGRGKRAATASITWTTKKRYHHLALAKSDHPAAVGPALVATQAPDSAGMIAGGGFVDSGIEWRASVDEIDSYVSAGAL